MGKRLKVLRKVREISILGYFCSSRGNIRMADSLISVNSCRYLFVADLLIIDMLGALKRTQCPEGTSNTGVFTSS